MAETASSMRELGSAVPDFNLLDVKTGKSFSLKDCGKAKGILVMFICNHCPYVQRVMSEFKRLDDDYSARGITIVAINSNSTKTHPQDGPDHMRKLAQREKWTFPFLFDEGQEVAKAFTAACTPDFFLYNQNQELVYRGQLDDARPGNTAPLNGRDLRLAMDAVLNNQPVSKDQRPSLGCNIKWHPGNQPRY